MVLTLNNYNLSCNDWAITAATLGSGAVYASRHWEQSHVETKWGHRTIAIIQFIPLIGGLAAIIERIIAWVLSYFEKSPIPLPAREPLPSPVRVRPPAPAPVIPLPVAVVQPPAPVVRPHVPNRIYYTDPHLLVRDTDAFFDTRVFPKADISSIEVGPSTTVEHLLTQLARHFPMIGVGETHQHSSAKYFLVQHLHYMVRLGWDHLFLEGYVFQRLQDDLDAYLKGRNPDIFPPALDRRLRVLERMQHKSSYYSERDVLKAAHRAGIKKLVALETTGSETVLDAFANCARGSRRIATWNYQAKLMIDNVGVRGIVYAGIAHLCDTKAVSGLGRICDTPFPSIYACDNNLDESSLHPSAVINKNVVSKIHDGQFEMEFVVNMQTPVKEEHGAAAAP